MDDDQAEVLAAYEAELASERALLALAIKLSWQPRPTGSAPDIPDPTDPDE